jgi:hypothetical protein
MHHINIYIKLTVSNFSLSITIPEDEEFVDSSSCISVDIQN